MADKIKYPFGAADAVVLEDAASVDLEITNQLTLVTVDTMSQAITVNATAGDTLEEGAEVIFAIDQGATGQNLVLGTGFEGTGITGVANDKDTLVCRYIGGVFRVISNIKTVDAA